MKISQQEMESGKAKTSAQNEWPSQIYLFYIVTYCVNWVTTSWTNSKLDAEEG